nr:MULTISPECIES: hypothetical protein [unclassified Sphingomonas]
MAYDKQKRLHFDLTNVGLRAQATAVGLVQLCQELRRANVLDDPAMARIKDAIADELSVTAPRSLSAKGYRGEVRARLDRIFEGEQQVGPAEALSFGAEPE